MVSKIETGTDFEEIQIKNNIITLPLTRKNQKEEIVYSDKSSSDTSEKHHPRALRHYFKEKLVRMGLPWIKKIYVIKHCWSQWRAKHPLYSLLLLWALAGLFGILIGGLAGVGLRTSLCDSTIF